MALPWSVLDCPAYSRLSYPARSLLLELSRQYVLDNNGRLLLSGSHLAKRGWTSNDVITRAKRELIESGFVHETVKGHRPNKASWYAVTWLALDRLPGYDHGAVESFVRSAYKNSGLTPSHGVEGARIAPPHGVDPATPTPSHGATGPDFGARPTPSGGDHLDKPSPSLQTGGQT